MFNLPLYLSLFFVAITIVAGVLVIYALSKKNIKNASTLYTVALLWMSAQAILGVEQFYYNGSLSAPKVLLATLPALAYTIYLAFANKYKSLFTETPLRWLIIFQLIRLPVEVILYFLSEEGVVPEEMTWQGRNWDILSGLSAPVIYWLYTDHKVSKRFVLVWNVVCLALLLNVMIMGFLSIPGPMQLMAYSQPNIAILSFPFIWLPSFLAPLTFLVHLLSIRKILFAIKEGRSSHRSRKKRSQKATIS